MALIALAVRLFPHPGTPVIKTPFGEGRLYFFAASDHELFLFSIQRFKFSVRPHLLDSNHFLQFPKPCFLNYLTFFV